MGVDYYSENAEISSFNNCIAAVVERLTQEAFEKVKQETLQYFLKEVKDEKFMQYAAEKGKEGQLQEILAVFETITYEERHAWVGWLQSAFDYYIGVYDDSDFAKPLWQILVDNSGIDGIKKFREVRVTYLSSNGMHRDMDNISEDELYLSFNFELYRKVLTSKAKKFAEIFGEGNLPEDASWVWISC